MTNADDPLVKALIAFLLSDEMTAAVEAEMDTAKAPSTLMEI